MGIVTVKTFFIISKNHFTSPPDSKVVQFIPYQILLELPNEAYYNH